MSDAKPKLQELALEIDKLSWSEVKVMAIQLGMDYKTLSNISEKHDISDRINCAMYTWLETDPKASWKKIVKALNNTHKIVLAEEIEKKYVSSNAPQASSSSSTNDDLEEHELARNIQSNYLPPSQSITLVQQAIASHSPSPSPSYHSSSSTGHPLQLLHYAYQSQIPHSSLHPPYHQRFPPPYPSHTHYPPQHSSHTHYTPQHPSHTHYPPQYSTASYHLPDSIPQPEHHQPTQASTYCTMQERQTITEPPAAKRPRYQQPSCEQLRLFTEFIDFVKTTYRRHKVERDPKVLKWPPTPSNVFINLACIDRNRISGKSKKYREVTEAMVHDGNMDVIYCHGDKFPIEMNEIASGLPYNTLETLILVEGAPGVGKSTFALEYCRRWERGEIAQQYQLVLLIRLRDDRNSKAKTLRDLIHHSTEGVAEAVNNILEATAGSNTMIILEGFDELPDTCRSVNSLFMQLISGQLLPMATVMVTSRPWATRNIHNNYHHRMFQHIEILGFTSEQITEYIESALPESMVSDLKVYLNMHPQIRAGMYIPLNSAIVVTVYQESQDSECDMPTTLTQLYTDLVRTLLVRYLRGHSKYNNIKKIQSFTDLPSEVYGKFLELCKVAYNGIVNTSRQVQLIFNEHDLPTDFDNLGFMDSVTELYVTKGTVTSHNFLHLTFQEFFAAVHISTMSPAQQLKYFIDHNVHHRRIDFGRMKVVLRFVAGITKLRCLSKESVKHFIHDSDNDSSENYSLSCDAEVDINLLYWMFETQRNDVIELFLEQKIIDVECDSDMSLMDYYSLGYCIAHSQCQWILRVSEW